MLRLDRRHQGHELMDSPDLNEVLHRRALDGLKRINGLSGTASVLWSEIRPLAEQHRGEALRMLDVACGGGDVAVSLARRAAREGYDLRIDGADISACAVRHATTRAVAAGVRGVRFHVMNALRDAFPGRYDVIVCSLFLHHLNEVEAVELLVRMREAAERLVLVSDLRRCWAGYLLAQVGCRLLTSSPIVHADGPQSVASAFTATELARLATQADLAGAVIRRRWPERLLLRWRRP